LAESVSPQARLAPVLLVSVLQVRQPALGRALAREQASLELPQPGPELALAPLLALPGQSAPERTVS
jgi:hypothetical protein